MVQVERMWRWYREHRGWLGYVGIFVIAFILFASFQLIPVFADPDSFYHAKVAVLLRDGHWEKTFTALPLTTLAHSYADQHFLYHFLLVPFVTIFDPLIGLKAATVVFAALMALTFYWFLRRWQVPWAFVTTIALLAVNPFTFRMNLAKASSLSIALLLLGLAAAFHYRPRLLFFISFAYVWFYGGFLLLVIGVLTFAVVSAWHRRYIRREDSNLFLQRVRGILGRRFRHGRRRYLNLQLALAVIGGTTLGVIINPYFPANVRFYFDQIIRIGAVNYQKVIGVGGEWYPYKFIELLANTVVVSIPLVVALALFAINFRRQSSRSMTLFLLWLFFFLMTLKSRRYIEYVVPFGLLFSAMSLSDSLRGWNWRLAWSRFRHTALRPLAAKVGVIAFAGYVVIALPLITIRDFKTERKDLSDGFRLDLFAEESQWIKEQNKPGAIVVHSDWDEFPILYYFNSDNRYIAGLDPTFFYLQDKELHQLWVDVTLGRSGDHTYDIIRNSLGAEFVFVSHDHEAMNRLLQDDSRFTLGITGRDGRVYEVH